MARPLIARLLHVLDVAFPATFWAFVAMTVGVLALALVPALVRVPAPPAGMPADAAGQIAQMLGLTALKTEDVPTLAVDYGLTGSAMRWICATSSVSSSAS